MTRLGQEYRRRCLLARGFKPRGERILDVGCHDGELLASLEGSVRIGADLNPPGPRNSVWLVQADGSALPFPSGSFDQVLALDVLEHVEDDDGFAREMVRVSRVGGSILVTTPADTIQLFPPFLTGWISRRWGHHWRRGYSEQRLAELVGDRCSCSVEQWNAPAYRTLYLFLRLLAVVWPALAGRCVDRIARYDERHSQGQQGFYWMWCDVEAGS